jgi:hypothetical protein
MPSMMRDAGMMTGRTARPARIASTTTGRLRADEDMQKPDLLRDDREGRDTQLANAEEGDSGSTRVGSR